MRESDPFLKDAISSVLNQSVKPNRVLVVVGTENPDCQSLSVARSFGAPVDPWQLRDVGIVPQLNFGLSLVDTEYVGFLDSDDMWHESKQERQLAQLSEDPSLDGVNGLVANFRDDSAGERRFLNSAESSVLGVVTFRTTTFSRFGRFDPESTHFTHLYRWTLRAKRMGLKIGTTGEVGLYRRVHARNGWVLQKEQGLAELHAELRHALRNRGNDPSLEKDGS